MLSVLMWLHLASASTSCEFSILKTQMPLARPAPICLKDYVVERDLARRDSEGLQFHDLGLFELPNHPGPLGESGRLSWARRILEAHRDSLRDDKGRCELRLFGDGRAISMADFRIEARAELGQPGTRLILREDHFQDPSWELICRDSRDRKFVRQSGSYFFLFVDVYENLGDPSLTGHLFQVLLSFH